MNDEMTLREIARLALMRLPADARARTIGQILIEDQEPHVLDRLAKLRAVISLRMQGLIEARFPQDDLSASPACDRAGKYATAPDEHPCYISGDDWERFGKIAGKDPEVLERIKSAHEDELARVDHENYPTDEHRVAYRRGLVDAHLNRGWPLPQEQKEPCRDRQEGLALAASSEGLRT